MKPAIAAALVVVFSVVASAADDQRRQRMDPRDQGPAIDAKMEYRMRAARAERAHADLQKTADQLADLSIDLSDQITKGTPFKPDDAKTLDEIKRLAKKVRGDFGGTGEPEMQNPPRTFLDSAHALGERARSLQDDMKTASRYEVNLKLIRLTGEMMILADILKHLGGQ